MLSAIQHQLVGCGVAAETPLTSRRIEDGSMCVPPTCAERPA
eukprot:COSAG03_NODE_20481_length_318_cov_1.406393_1_plen_41_part_10